MGEIAIIRCYSIFSANAPLTLTLVRWGMLWR